LAAVEATGWRLWDRVAADYTARYPELGVGPLFAAPAHPRYGAFDWETWHELDVLRGELAPRITAQKL
jgi:hypothetical protein